MSPSSRSCGNVSGTASGCTDIEHKVSKMDTLAGIAIKYGVEVADIKRKNGLATDFQIFAMKTLLIPLPGRHPPSASMPNSAASSRDKSAEKASSSSTGQYNLSKSSELLKCKSSQQKASPFISASGYGGVEFSNPKELAEGAEMTICGAGTSCIHNNRLKGHELPASDSTSYPKMGAGFLVENGSDVDYTSIFDVIDNEGEGFNRKSTRNCQETEAGSLNATPEELLKENGGGNDSLLATRGKKALALRAKSASRASSLATNAQLNWTNLTRLGARDDTFASEHPGLQKALTVSSLQVQDTTNSSSIWQTSKWSLKPDLSLFSAAPLTRPILDGLALPKTISGWRNKAARD